MVKESVKEEYPYFLIESEYIILKTENKNQEMVIENVI